MMLPAGTRVGPYEILAALGAGGMGEVYRARDTRLDRDVAVKILPALFAADHERLARFEREAKTLASLNHPNIAAIHGIEETGSSRALVMELVDGENLAERLAGGAIAIDEALPIARQIADALEAAHERGIVHRDLKPANIMLTSVGDVKVLDFGLAKATDPSGGSRAAHDLMNSPTITSPATQLGTILGTAAYMAPEQAKGKTVDKRADIWAFGVVLYEMLTGARPFAGETATDVIAGIVTREPNWSALPAATPRLIRELLARCLEKEPRRRLRDIGEARVMLERTGTAGADAPTMSRAKPKWRDALGWAAAGAALTAAVAGGWIASKRPSPAPAIARFAVSPPSGAQRLQAEGFAVSPDGRILAFSARSREGQSRIYTRRLDEPQAQPVPGSDNGTLPFWSPDSRSLAFTKDGGLYRVDLDSGTQRQLCDIPGPVDGPQFAGSAGTWGSAGVIVFAARTRGLFRVDQNGGIPAPLTSLDNDAVHASPSFLPDGKHVLFLALAQAQTRGPVYAIALEDGTRTRVTESSGGAQYVDGLLLTTTPAPRSLVAQAFDPDRLTLDGPVFTVREHLGFATSGGRQGFSASANGVLVVERAPERLHRLSWMDRGGRVVGTVGPEGRIPDFALAPNENQVVARITDGASLRSDLWMFNGSGGPGTRLTFRLDTRRPMWSRDGTRLYFTTMPGWELWSLVVGAAEPQTFAPVGTFTHFEDSTRDGRYVIAKSGLDSPDISIHDVRRPGEGRVLVRSNPFLSGARVSPDGRWLAYTVNLPSGPEVFLQPFDRPGAAQQVSRNGGFGPVWRADGREMYYERSDTLMAVGISQRAERLEIGTPQRLFAIRTQGFVPNQPHNVEVAANGQRFLVNTLVGSSDDAPLEVTLNWAAGGKK